MAHCPSNVKQVYEKKGNTVVSFERDRENWSPEMCLDVAKCGEKYRAVWLLQRKLLACYTMSKQHSRQKREARFLPLIMKQNLSKRKRGGEKVEGKRN